ncbi:Hsp70 family protein, partial [Streptomyces sp. NPDC004012]
MAKAVGIDLGTTNSVIAVWEGASMSFVKAPRLGLRWFDLWGLCGEFDVLGG